MPRYGFDVSNWNGEISPALAACFAANGQTCAVVRASLEDSAKAQLVRRQIQALQGAGLTVMAYLWCYHSEDPGATAQQYLAAYGDLGLHLVWLDVEETDPRFRGESPAQRRNWLRACLDTLEAAGARCGLYTANWYWGPYLGGTDAFKDYPLWVAEYDDIPDLAVFYPFGGWGACAGKQFTGSGALCGVNPLDLNVFSDELFGTPEEPAVPEQTDAEKLSYLSALTADVLPAVIAELEQVRPKAQADAAHLDRALTALRAHAG